MTDTLQRVLRASEPLTLAGVPAGFLPVLAADLARAAHGSSKGGRAVLVASDEMAMRALVGDRAAFRAGSRSPDPAVVGLSSLRPHLACPARHGRATIDAECAAGEGPGPQLLVVTENAATQRLLSPFRVRQLTQRIEEGARIDRDQLVKQLNSLGYERVESVAEHGEYAVRGSLVDLFPAGETMALRLDFFGDEIESLRRFDPADQRSTDRAKAFTLMPASEALLDEETIKRFRSRYRETFGATATGDPLYEAISDGRRMSGMEHWLPLFEERLTTLFDHLGENDLIVRDARGGPGARGTPGIDRRLLRQPQEDDVRRGRQLSSARARRALSHRGRMEGGGSRAARSISPRSSPSPRASGSSASASSRRATSRPSGRSRRTFTRLSPSMSASFERAVTRSYSPATALGARERLAGLLTDHGLKSQKLVDSWQEALGQQDAAGADGPAARPRVHRARRRRPYRAGHARRSPRPPPQEAQGRGGLPVGTGDAHRRAISSFTTTMASAATRGCSRSWSARRRTIASRWNMRAATSSTSRSRISTC